jgi:hypothetical protein
MPLVWAHAFQHCFADPTSAPAVAALRKAHATLLPTRAQEQALTRAIGRANALSLPPSQRPAALSALMRPLFEDVRAFNDNDWQYFHNLLHRGSF